MFANTSSMITVIIAVPLMRAFSADGSASDAMGYFWAVLITCMLGIPTMVVCCWKTKEVVTPSPSQEGIPMKAQMKSLVKNRPVIILIQGQFILGCVIYGRAAMLAAMNYVANGQQTPQVLNAINWFITLIPAVISAINGVLYLMYPISTKRHKEIMGELIRRRQTDEE